MFKKYKKTFRILVPEIDVKGKFFLSEKETQFLLAGAVIVEEKMDGANTGIIRHKRGFHLQKRYIFIPNCAKFSASIENSGWRNRIGEY